jgi:hypothetical protein
LSKIQIMELSAISLQQTVNEFETWMTISRMSIL